MKRITLILALVFMTSLAFSDLKATQSWLKKHGRTYTINQLKNLKKLNIGYTHVSDLTPLKGLKNLEYLHLDRIYVSKQDRLELEKALPKCKIYYDGE